LSNRIIIAIVPIFILTVVSISFADLGVIEGYVYDENGYHMVGPTVSILGTSYGCFTDGNGWFSIGDLKPGLYDLSAHCIWYYADTLESLEVTPGDTLLVDFVLIQIPMRSYELRVSGPTGRAKGFVTDENGEPMNDAIVSVPGSAHWITTTNHEDEYILQLPDGLFSLEARHAG